MESLKARGALTSDWEMRNHDLSDQSCFCFHLELWEIWQRLRETQSLALPVWTEASRVIAMKMDEIIFKNREGDQCKKLQGKNLNNKLYFLFCYIYNNVQYGHLFQKKSSTFLQLFCVYVHCQACSPFSYKWAVVSCSWSNAAAAGPNRQMVHCL